MSLLSSSLGQGLGAAAVTAASSGFTPDYVSSSAPPIIQIADVAFTGFEIPQSVDLGGDQSTVIHKMLGGARIIDALGMDEAPITWEGRFRGAEAVGRAQRLDALRQQGLPVQLTIYTMKRSVIIRSFKWDFMQYYEIPYSITCEVIQNQDAPVLTAPIDLDASLEMDLASVVALADTIAAANLTAAMADIVALQATYGRLGLVPTPIMTSALEAAQLAAGAVLAGTMGTLDSLNDVTGLPVTQAISAIGGAAPLLSGANTVQCQATLGRMLTNVTSVF